MTVGRNMYFGEALAKGMMIVRSQPKGLAYLAIDEDGTKHRLFWHSRACAVYALDRAIERQKHEETK
tara:strand:+ start:356 stop:556 length:201 start_codon:yes stop_codon:yes gene_type:complete